MYTYVYIYVCIYVYTIYMHIYIYIYIYIYIEEHLVSVTQRVDAGCAEGGGCIYVIYVYSFILMCKFVIYV